MSRGSGDVQGAQIARLGTAYSCKRSLRRSPSQVSENLIVKGAALANDRIRLSSCRGFLRLSNVAHNPQG